MAKKKQESKPKPTFEVRFIGQDISPETIPLRSVNDALSAIQDIASGRNPSEEDKVPFDKGIGLIDVKRGSAVYSCLARSPGEALENLGRIGSILTSAGSNLVRKDEDSLISSLPSIRSLSQIARSIGCKLVVTARGRIRTPLVSIGKNDYSRISKRMFVKGETTIVGTIERAGGATEMRCLLRVPGRRRLLYANVRSKELVRRLGHHLYESIAATGTAVWINHSWRVQQFTIGDFSIPKMGDPSKLITDLREAGLSAWDDIENPDQYIQELRS